MATIAEYAALTQNRIVEWAAILPYGHFDYTLPEWAMWVIYALFTVVTILLWIVPKEQKSMGIDI
jgi:hypothetical protein